MFLANSVREIPGDIAVAVPALELGVRPPPVDLDDPLRLSAARLDALQPHRLLAEVHEVTFGDDPLSWSKR